MHNDHSMLKGLQNGTIKLYQLETLLGNDNIRAVSLRQQYTLSTKQSVVQHISQTKTDTWLPVDVHPAGRELFIRFSADAGDAMGMNMLSNGVQKALSTMQNGDWPDMKVLSLSGNVCVDKKVSGINTLLGRGKSVTAQILLRRDVLSLSSTASLETIHNIVEANNLSTQKAGSVEGFSLTAAQTLAAVFTATGQDLAQLVESSSAIVSTSLLSPNSLLLSVSLPCLEMATVGGGTGLPAQSANLDSIIPNRQTLPTGEAVRTLSSVTAALVLASELAALCEMAEQIDLFNSD
ncbi:putative 3-hydroxy-3-methylglutaryl-coenzyme A reductase 2 [Blattamonas nauphoetae]|uniref:hydroxymethylglutaryl-CoA reductase (NADPH) n=1 Tax=Blattamonas nauphoetae TaxID=2049346 RepID=A0ABQ9YES1_9EUKA|nr:putative 3-hydroxy-3-methylglutaryl-coenzyme A reductase 2 [Blattamonas nauphoetae]